MRKASMTIGNVNITYVQVLYDNRYFKVTYSKSYSCKPLMIPCCERYILDALIDGLMRKESGNNTISNGGEGVEYNHLQNRYENFIGRVAEKDKWLDRE